MNFSFFSSKPNILRSKVRTKSWVSWAAVKMKGVKKREKMRNWVNMVSTSGGGRALQVVEGV